MTPCWDNLGQRTVTIEKRSSKGGTTWRVRTRRLGQPHLTKSFETKKAA